MGSLLTGFLSQTIFREFAKSPETSRRVHVTESLWGPAILQPRLLLGGFLMHLKIMLRQLTVTAMARK